MGDKSNIEIIQEVCERLEVSQEVLEKNAFEAINHQDKTNAMITMSMSNVMELLSSLELIGMELESVAMEFGDKFYEPVQKLNEVLVKQSEIVAEIGSVFQQMLNEQDVLTSALHIMEDEIACHRDSIEMAEELLLSDVELHNV